MTALALDTSVAVPLLVANHPEHAAVARWVGARAVALTGHSLVETYSVLTRLPGGSRVSPSDAARLVEEDFDVPLLLGPTSAARVPALLAGLGIAGGATYDALVGLAAREHGAVLATRDERARPTYEAVGVSVVVAG